MKLPITDQFLWDLYTLLDKTEDVLTLITKPPTMANYLPGPKNPVFDKYRKNKQRDAFSKFIYRLKSNNYIQVKNLQGQQAIMLTKDGLGKALQAGFIIEGKKKRNDGKWIMLIFDVPEKRRKSRDLLRSILYNLGYKLFQQSVWVSPYDVSEKTEQLLRMYSLDEYVKIFLIEAI